MTEKTDPTRQSCIDACETKFLRCTKRTRTGCVEVLRMCKETRC